MYWATKIIAYLTTRACSKRRTKRAEKFEERKTRGPERMVLIREDRRVRVTKPD